MAKRKTLNGLPNTLNQQYFSTLFWWNRAYMADWIWNAANEIGVTEMEIDILSSLVLPRELEIKPITAQLPKLKETISITLQSNGFPLDFITEAKFQISIPQLENVRKLRCQGIIVDKEGSIYYGKIYSQISYCEPFKTTQSPLIDKINSLLKPLLGI